MELYSRRDALDGSIEEELVRGWNLESDRSHDRGCGFFIKKKLIEITLHFQAVNPSDFGVSYF